MTVSNARVRCDLCYLATVKRGYEAQWTQIDTWDVCPRCARAVKTAHDHGIAERIAKRLERG